MVRILGMVSWIVVIMASHFALAGPTQRFLMAAMGDSITVGYFADLALPRQGRGAKSAGLLRPQRVFSNKRSFSWASGERIESQYQLLKESLKRTEPGAELEVLNVAVPGGRTRDMADQAKKVVK